MNQSHTELSEDQLISEHARVVVLISDVKDAVAFSDTILGKKISKRLNEDLVAIRKKYATIDGTPDEMALLLARIQGRERELAELVSYVCGSRQLLEHLNMTLDRLSLLLKRNKGNTLR